MNKTINDLEQITTVSTSDELPIFSENETKKVTVEQLRGKEVYTAEETKTNKVWIDGKPIYRKIFVFTSTNNNNTQYPIPYCNCFVNAYLCLKTQNYASCSPSLNSIVGGSSAWGTENFAIKTLWTDGTTWSATGGFIMFEYTKSTD